MEPGWIYVLVNSTIPGLAKVGRTTRAPNLRVAELSAATGVATPFVLAFDHPFADCVSAERDIHKALDARGLRLMDNREFFSGSPGDIARIILAHAGGGQAASARPTASSVEALLARGDNYRLGKGSALQDTAEATRCYRLAARAGSLIAHEHLARMQLAGDAPDRIRRALQHLKEGAQCGNYYCFADMAGLYASQGHVANSLKAWNLFFGAREAGQRAEIEAWIGAEPGGCPGRYTGACRRYISMCLELGREPDHLALLRREADAILRLQVTDADRLRDEPGPRSTLAAVLRWSYINLARPAGITLQPAHTRPRRCPGRGAPATLASEITRHLAIVAGHSHCGGHDASGRHRGIA